MNVAIVVAASQYSGAVSSLPACRNDADAMTALLRAEARFDDVLVVVENTTASTVKQKVVEFVARHKSTSIDEVLFYFSGHGEFVGTEFYYLLSDYDPKRRSRTSFENSEIDNLLRALSPRLAIKIVDACTSGVTYIKEPGALEAYLKGTQATFKSCYFMFSSHLDQSSYADADLSHFTRSLASAVLTHPGPSIRYKDLIDYISDTFEANSQQKPFFVAQADFTDQFCGISDTLRADLRRLLHISDGSAAGGAAQPDKANDLHSAAITLSSTHDAMEAELTNRLAAFKSFPAVGSKEHYGRLRERIDVIATRLQQAKDDVKSFGLEKSIHGPAHIGYALKAFSKEIVQNVESRGYRPLHDVRSEQQTHQPLQTRIEKAMGFSPPPPTTSTVYTLQQRGYEPESYVALETSSDGHVPAGMLFFYLLPLQLRACLYAGIAVKGEGNAAEEDWSLGSLGSVLLDLDGADEERIDRFVAGRIAVFNLTLRAAVARRVKLLEEEKNQ